MEKKYILENGKQLSIKGNGNYLTIIDNDKVLIIRRDKISNIEWYSTRSKTVSLFYSGGFNDFAFTNYEDAIDFMNFVADNS